MNIMLMGLIPFALSQAYAGTLRETGETTLPMRAGIVAVFVNLIMNYILIYGHLGFKPMGVRGAAIATVISRFVELGILAFHTHTGSDKYRFIKGAYRSLKMPPHLAKLITIKGMPLLINEAVWSIGVAMLMRCYATRGLNVIAALNITSTVSNLFSVVFGSMGNATAIILGQELGANEIENARDHCWKLLTFNILCCLAMMAIMALCAPGIPTLYNTSGEVRELSTQLLLVSAGCMPLYAFATNCYFTLRSGGKTVITLLFDCVSTVCVSLPLAYALVTFSSLDIVWIYGLVQCADIVKCTFGFIMMKKGIWIHNMVSGSAAEV